MTTTDYTAQAETFLASNGIKFRATLSDSKTAPWGSKSGHHYRVTLSKAGTSPTLWGYAIYHGETNEGMQNGDKVEVVGGDEKTIDVVCADFRYCNMPVGKFSPFYASDKPSRLTFDFWGSIADQRAGKKTVSAYDVLACISSDVYCPDTFKDFCGEYGYDTDSIEALQTFRRCSRFAKRLREFFTAAELEKLSQIQ